MLPGRSVVAAEQGVEDRGHDSISAIGVRRGPEVFLAGYANREGRGPLTSPCAIATGGYRGMSLEIIRAVILGMSADCAVLGASLAQSLSRRWAAFSSLPFTAKEDAGPPNGDKDRTLAYWKWICAGANGSAVEVGRPPSR